MPLISGKFVKDAIFAYFIDALNDIGLPDAELTTVLAEDWGVIFDLSDGIFKKVQPSNMPGGSGVSNPMTEDLAAGGFKITGLGDATETGDAVHYGQLTMGFTI